MMVVNAVCWYVGYENGLLDYYLTYTYAVK